MFYLLILYWFCINLVATTLILDLPKKEIGKHDTHIGPEGVNNVSKVDKLLLVHLSPLPLV